MQSNTECRPEVVDINQKRSVQSHFSGSAVTSWQDRYFKTDFESVAFQDRMQAALKCLRQFGRRDMSVLDIGCGAGVEALAVKSEGHAVVACDLSFEMAQLTRQRLLHLDAQHGAPVLVAGQRATAPNGWQFPFGTRAGRDRVRLSANRSSWS